MDLTLSSLRVYRVNVEPTGCRAQEGVSSRNGINNTADSSSDRTTYPLNGVDRYVWTFSERMLPQVVSQLWDLKENGRTGEEIAALLGWKKTAVFDHIQEHGGIRPRWGRNLQGRSLSFEERQEIMIWNSHQLSVREIGRRLGRSHSTISRELRRNVMPRNSYRATTAHRIAFDAARRARPGKLSLAGPLRDRVITGLKDKLSPEQISGGCAVTIQRNS